MKHLPLKILMCLFIFCSCSDDDQEEGIIGQWKLTQVLADPGDGSGVFTDIESNKSLTFFNDNTFQSNGGICFFSPLEDRPTNGIFSLEDEEIIPTNCESFAQIKYAFKVEGSSLTIYYQCIEACAEKYRKIE